MQFVVEFSLFYHFVKNFLNLDVAIQQYNIGENESIYLHYENGIFFPVFKPSVYFAIRIQKLVVIFWLLDKKNFWSRIEGV